jgi:hypothetical protein
MPQGRAKKIQFQLLLANLPLQLFDLPALAHRRTRITRSCEGGFHRPVRFARTSRPAKSGLAALGEPIAPTIQQLALYPQLFRQAVNVICLSHPLQRGQLEIPGETASLALWHTRSPR